MTANDVTCCTNTFLRPPFCYKASIVAITTIHQDLFCDDATLKHCYKFANRSAIMFLSVTETYLGISAGCARLREIYLAT